MEATEKTLDTFNWDEQVKDIDFFGESAPEGMVIDIQEEKAPEDKKIPEEGKVKEKQEEEIPEDIFSDILENKEDDEEEEGEKEVKNQTKASFKNLYTSLKSNGIFEDEEEEDTEVEITEDYLIEKFESSVEKRFEESIKELPKELKNIIKFVSNGGNLNEILNQYSESSAITADLDMDEEGNQERVLRALLTEEGHDEEVVDSQIEFYKDSGKLKSVSQKYFDKWKKEREEEIEYEVSKQKLSKQQAIESQKAFKKELTSFISENESIKGLGVTKKDITDLPDYISNASIKLQDGRQITPFYRDLFESFKDKENIVILAKLVKNGFDFGDIKKEVSTKQTREIKNDLQRQKKSTKEAHKRLIDLI